MNEASTPHASQRDQVHSTGQRLDVAWRSGQRHTQDEDASMMENSESQNTELMTQNELTQLGEFEEDGLSPLPPQSPLNPKSIPWGRLIPCSRHHVSARDGESNGRREAGGMDLLPREPPTEEEREPGVSFLGIHGLKAGDVFNAYTLGRSNKCDVVAVKPPPDESEEENDAALQDWAHAMISNRHCRIFCMLKSNANNGSSTTDMDVYVEDTSGNGTLINHTTLLRRGEKRILHTGDELSLVNPATLRKKIRSNEVLSDLQRHHSFIFVNVFQQQGRQSSILASVRERQTRSGPMPPPSSVKRRGVVDVRATNNHSFTRPYAPAHSLDAVLQPRPSSRRVSPRRQPPRRVEEEYDIRELLGSGTCGEVRRAIHRHTGEQLAVKIIALGGRNRASRFAEESAAFEAEVSILQALDHPYVVKLVDVFVSPGIAVYLVMELLHGGDLFDRIVHKGKYSEEESRRVMRRLLNAIYYLHEIKNVVHRDLKPENILCVNRESDIDVKLTDFGLAKSVTDDGLKTFCGTPQYFAPEVLRRRHTVAGRGRYGKQADMWSLGVILYILLSGTPPFDVSEGLDSVADAKIEFPDDRWSGISGEAKDLVRKLLLADPKARMSVKDACNHDWIMAADGDTHIYPLDDPVVARAFEESQMESLSKMRLFAGEEDGEEASNDSTSTVDESVSASKQPSSDTATADVPHAFTEQSLPPEHSLSKMPTQDKRATELRPEKAAPVPPRYSTPEETEAAANTTVPCASIKPDKCTPEAPVENPSEAPVNASMPDTAKTSSNAGKPCFDSGAIVNTGHAICETPAPGSPGGIPLSLNARSNNFRVLVAKSVEKKTPRSGTSNADELSHLCNQLERTAEDNRSKKISPDEKRGPKGILITPKSADIVTSLPSTNEVTLTRQTAATKEKSKKRNGKVKVTLANSSGAAELTEDEILSQFSDEGDSISSCSTSSDDNARKNATEVKIEDAKAAPKPPTGNKSVKTKGKASKRPTSNAAGPPKKRTKRRIVLGQLGGAARATRDGTAVSDEDITAKETALTKSTGISKSGGDFEKENKTTKCKESDDAKGAGGRQTTLSSWFRKKEA